MAGKAIRKAGRGAVRARKRKKKTTTGQIFSNLKKLGRGGAMSQAQLDKLLGR